MFGEDMQSDQLHVPASDLFELLPSVLLDGYFNFLRVAIESKL
jgi:hypothetical protein